MSVFKFIAVHTLLQPQGLSLFAAVKKGKKKSAGYSTHLPTNDSLRVRFKDIQLVPKSQILFALSSGSQVALLRPEYTHIITVTPSIRHSKQRFEALKSSSGAQQSPLSIGFLYSFLNKNRLVRHKDSISLALNISYIKSCIDPSCSRGHSSMVFGVVFELKYLSIFKTYQPKPILWEHENLC